MRKRTSLGGKAVLEGEKEVTSNQGTSPEIEGRRVPIPSGKPKRNTEGAKETKKQRG